MIIAFLVLCLVLSPVFSANANLSRSGNFKCADVYCINLDTYSKLDVPTDPIRVGHQSFCHFTSRTYLLPHLG